MKTESEMEPNQYRRWAEYYDRDPRNLYSDDIDFFVARASRTGGPVLELACGTGRVTLPLAEAGFDITALDHSEAMLEVFRQKLMERSPGLQSRIRIVRGDMSEFDLRQRFPFIFVPFRSFQALVTRREQLACLAGVRRHLAPDGEFVVNVFRPKMPMDQSWVQPKQRDWEILDEATGNRISRHSEPRAIDIRKQILDIDVSFEIANGSGLIESFTDPLRLAYFHEEQLVGLIEEAGLRVTERYGYYDGTPIDRGSEFILVCRGKG